MYKIYLDYNATTPLDPEVLQEMLPYFTENFGNASSKTHTFGNIAYEAVELSRRRIANLINANQEEIVFTSGSTESINLAIKGIVEASGRDKIHIITSSIEHKAVLDVCKYLENFGIEISYLKVDSNGIVNPDDLKYLIKPYTLLVSVMTANNEIGSIQPIAEVSKICREKNILFHTDATQAIGKIPFNLNDLKIDLISFSAHKMYGPKGIGALYINKASLIKPVMQMHGGGHERGFRSGTLNVPAIVGFGKAADISKTKLFDEFKIHTISRDRIIQNILNNTDNTVLNGHPVKRLPGNINFTIKDITNSMFVSEFRELAVSFGSACSSETLEPSYVLSAIGRDKTQIASSIRLSFGRFTTEDEINFIIKRIPEGIKNLKK